MKWFNFDPLCYSAVYNSGFSLAAFTFLWDNLDKLSSQSTNFSIWQAERRLQSTLHSEMSATGGCVVSNRGTVTVLLSLWLSTARNDSEASLSSCRRMLRRAASISTEQTELARSQTRKRCRQSKIFLGLYFVVSS